MDLSKTNKAGAARGRRPLRIAAIAMSSVAAIALLAEFGPVQATTDQQPAAPQASTPWSGYADLIEHVMPSVVGIIATRAPDEQLVKDQGQDGDPRRRST